MKGFKWKWRRQVVWLILGVFLALIGYSLLQLIEPIRIAPVKQSTAPVQFDGGALLIASDADMVATAYADAQLDRVPGVEDTLTVVGLPLKSNEPTIAPVQVSNSVMSWAQIIAVSPDGQWAYVAEVPYRNKPLLMQPENH